MYRYDPDKTPDPDLWLSLDEQERIQLVEAFHQAERIKLPNEKAHAVFHAIVENQIAEQLESVARAMKRLQDQGLSRHDSLHAVGWVLAQHFYELMNVATAENPPVANARYDAAIERLTAATWRAQAES